MRAAKPTLIVLALLIGLLAGVLFASMLTPAESAGRKVCPHARTQTARVSCLVKAVRWERKVRAQVIRSRYTPAVVDYACRLGYAAFKVAVAHCKKVVGCESGGNTREENSIGASGLAQFLHSTWRGTRFGRAGFSVFDAVPNVLAMDQIAAVSGFDTGYGWAASHGCHGLSGPEAR